VAARARGGEAARRERAQPRERRAHDEDDRRAIDAVAGLERIN
jgi:hypothetical protein